MKNFAFVFLMAVATTCFTACSTSTTTDSASDSGLKKGEYDLSRSGVNIVIKAPSDPAVESTPLGYDVHSSDVFRILISEGSGDVAQKKKDLQSDEVYKLTRMIVDEPNATMYEISFADKKEFHFFVVAKGSKNTYEIQDYKNKLYTEEEVKAMFDAAKSSRVL
jgi:hypothetical protein